MIRPNIACCTWKDAYLTLVDGDRVIMYFQNFIPDEITPLVIKIDYHGDDPMNSSVATLPLAAMARDAADYYPHDYVIEEEYSYEDAIKGVKEVLQSFPRWQIAVKDEAGNILWENTRYDELDGAAGEVNWLVGKLSESYTPGTRVEKFWAPVRTGSTIEILLPDGDTQVYNMKGEHLFIRAKESPSATELDKAEAARFESWRKIDE